MESDAPERVLRFSGKFLPDFSAIPALNAILDSIAALAEDGLTVKVAGTRPLAALCERRHGGVFLDWVLIIEQIRDLMTTGETLGWWAQAAWDERTRWKTRKLGEAAGNGLDRGEIAHLIQNLSDSTRLEETDETASTLRALQAQDYRQDEPAPVLFGDPSGEVLFPRGDLVACVGETGRGKSFFGLAACCATALGLPLVGFPCAAPGRAASINGDGDGEKVVLKRIVRLLAGMGSGLEVLDGPNLRVHAPEKCCLDDEGDFSSVRKFLDDFDPDFLDLGSLNSLMGPKRERKDEGSFGEFLRTRIRPLQLRPDGSRRTLHLQAHLRKRSGEKGANRLIDRVAGSFYFVAGVDSMFALDGDGKESFLLVPLKRTRWGVTFREFIVAIEGEPPDSPIILRNAGHVRATQTETALAEDAVLSAMATFPPGTWLQMEDIKRLCPRHEARTVERAGKALAARGRLEPHPKTRGRYRTPLSASQGGLPMEESA